jgi:SAM-dependent methyltransferase
MANTLYDGDFYARHRDQSIESARIVAPLVMRLATIKSVIDVGCGVGGWLRAFSENGATTVRGLDGNYVDRSKLHIPSECFSEIDLQGPLRLEGRYDLAVCLEVAEHLDPQAGGELVRALTAVAPLILFSAAVPGQGGNGHVNEQWPAYWRRLFERHSFRMLDVIRPMIRDERRVEWWYRQNIVMFASEEAMAANPALRETLNDGRGLEWIHIDMLSPPHAGVRNLLVYLRPLLKQAVRKRLPVKSASRPPVDVSRAGSLIHR